MSDTPLHVELVGLPGAGKTTLAKAMSARNGEVYPIKDAYKKSVLRNILPQTLDSISRVIPLAMINRFRDYQNIPQVEDLKKIEGYQTKAAEVAEEFTTDPERTVIVKGWLNDLIIERSLVDIFLSPSEIVVWDEGFLQRSASVFCPPNPSKGYTKGDIQKLTSKIPRVDIIVVLEVPIETSHNRLSSRPRGLPDAYKDLNVETIEHRFKQIRECIEIIVSSCRGSTSTVRIDGTNSVDQIRTEIDTFVKSHPLKN
jgi:adenylate kinase family enzyme